MTKEKVRLDSLLVSANLVESRERARSLILSGKVEIAGKRQDKPGARVPPDACVRVVRPDHPFVSRGGVKLEGALREFGLDPAGRVALDVGASTGGFTHCLLLNGVRRVYAVDVGYGQFAWPLRQDPRVILFEKTNIRQFPREKIPEPLDLAVVDVSFISLRKVLPCVLPFLAGTGEMLCLIKPQFEVGRGKVGKQGVVRDQALVDEVLVDIASFARAQGLGVGGVRESVLRGPRGNHEYFIHLRLGIRN